MFGFAGQGQSIFSQGQFVPHVAHAQIQPRTYRLGDVTVLLRASEANAEVKELHGELLPVTYSDQFYQSLTFIVVAQDASTKKLMGVVTARYSFEDLGRSVPNHLVRSSPYAYISTFGVKKEYRQKGIGTLLLKMMLSLLCQDRRSVEVVLHVKCGNEVALKLYQKMGFQCIGIAQSHYRIEEKEHHAWTLVKRFDTLPPSPRPALSVFPGQPNQVGGVPVPFQPLSNLPSHQHLRPSFYYPPASPPTYQSAGAHNGFIQYGNGVVGPREHQGGAGCLGSFVK